jgi:hypothetical protein
VVLKPSGFEIASAHSIPGGALPFREVTDLFAVAGAVATAAAAIATGAVLHTTLLDSNMPQVRVRDSFIAACVVTAAVKGR